MGTVHTALRRLLLDRCCYPGIDLMVRVYAVMMPRIRY